MKNYQIQIIIGANPSYLGFSGISSVSDWLRILEDISSKTNTWPISNTEC